MLEGAEAARVLEILKGDAARAYRELHASEPDALVLDISLGRSIVAGAEVEIADNGQQALTTMRAAAQEQNPFQVALLDNLMPGMSGLELLSAIKQEWPQTEVVIMTSESTPEKAVGALTSGALTYLTKPFDDIGEPVEVAGRIQQRLLLS